MNNIVILQHRITTVLLLFCASIVSAQSTYKESFDVGQDVLVSVNTSHTNVVFETWNKNKVEVEAYIDDDKLSEKEKKEIFDSWNLDVLGNSKKVVITSNEGSLWTGIESMGSLKALQRLKGMEGMSELKLLEHLKDMPVLKELGDMDWEFEVPDVPDFREFPNWPFGDEQPNISIGKNNSNYTFGGHNSNNFDRDDYEDDKQGYVNKLNKKHGSNATVRQTDAWLSEVDQWASEFEDVMEKWGENFGNKFEMKFGPEFEKKMEKWGEEFGKEMEVWGEEFGEKFGKEMEEWGEEFGKDMEKWAEQFEHDVEKWTKEYDDDGDRSIFIKSGNSFMKEGAVKAKKTIIIRLPKGSKTKINVRHGELKMADASNVKATLNYATLTANSIDGGETLINAAYAPVYVNNWINGHLELQYVDDCKLNKVTRINLEANSSDVNINSVTKEAFLFGSFGNLFINDIADSFETIDIVLENTDATLSIPNTSFAFYYNGKKSRFKAPASFEITTRNVNDSRSILKGFHKGKNSGRSLTINAAYSNVSIKN